MARLAETKHFSNTLRRMIDEHFEGNMSELSRRSGVALGTLGHYVRPGNDGRFPSPAQAEKIMKALPKAAKLELLRAMVADVVPKSLLPKLEIGLSGTDSQPQAVAKLRGLPDSTMEAVQFLGRLAIDSLDIRRMLETTAVAMGMKRD